MVYQRLDTPSVCITSSSCSSSSSSSSSSCPVISGPCKCYSRMSSSPHLVIFSHLYYTINVLVAPHQNVITSSISGHCTSSLLSFAFYHSQHHLLVDRLPSCIYAHPTRYHARMGPICMPNSRSFLYHSFLTFNCMS